MRRTLLATALWLLASCTTPPGVPTPEQQAEAVAWAKGAGWTIGSHYALRREPGRDYPQRLARTVVRFAVDRFGRIANSEVATSSGYPAVDEAAVRAVQSTPALPPPPAWAFQSRSPSDPALLRLRDGITVTVPDLA